MSKIHHTINQQFCLDLRNYSYLNITSNYAYFIETKRRNSIDQKNDEQGKRKTLRQEETLDFVARYFWQYEKWSMAAFCRCLRYFRLYCI